MTDTKAIIEALRVLAKDYQGFGSEEEIVRLAADRLEKQQRRIRNQRREIEALAKDKKRVDGFVNWLDGEIHKLRGIHSTHFDHERERTLVQAKWQLEKLRNGLGEKPKCELCDDHGGLAITGPPGPRSPIVPCPRCNP